MTWGIPDHYGGMTSAILRRSAGFAAAGAPVSILTFDDRLDTGDLVTRLRARGELAEGVDVLHLWDWLAVNPVRPRPPLPEFRPIDPRGAVPIDGRIEEFELAGVVRRREVRSPDGEVLQVDRYRPDGSLLASDLRADGERPRSVVVCTTDGSPVAGWSSMWGLYRHWLDRITAGRRSMMIVDSKTAARFMTGYTRGHVATVHLLHNAHRSGSGEPGSGLRASRRDVLQRASDFDAVVVLTERQRDDLASDLGSAVTIEVIPNAMPIEQLVDAPLGRPVDQGVMLASLTMRKRVGHATAAAAGAGTRLDVYGEGPERDSVRARIEDLGLAQKVRLHGHHPDAALAFRRSSFSLLTSTFEGAPLVLVESMAAGCIPIAYDIRYGPGDMIRDGIDGFLVPPDDVEQMAARIRGLVEMREGRRRRMRRAARRSASRYASARVAARWGILFADIAQRRWPAAQRASLPSRVARRLRRAWRDVAIPDIERRPSSG